MQQKGFLFGLLALLLILGCSESGVKPPPESPREQWGLVPLRTGNAWRYESYKLDAETGEKEGRFT